MAPAPPEDYNDHGKTVTFKEEERTVDVTFRNYTDQAGITEDYHKVRAFFVKLGPAIFELSLIHI